MAQAQYDLCDPEYLPEKADVPALQQLESFRLRPDEYFHRSMARPSTAPQSIWWEDSDLRKFIIYSCPRTSPTRTMFAFWMSCFGHKLRKKDPLLIVLNAILLFCKEDHPIPITSKYSLRIGDPFPDFCSDLTYDTTGEQMRLLDNHFPTKQRTADMMEGGLVSTFWEEFEQLKEYKQLRMTQLCAAVFMRLIIKSTEHVSRVISEKLLSGIADLLKISTFKVSTLPTVSPEFLNQVKAGLADKDRETRHVIAVCLSIYSEHFDDPKVAGVLKAGFLLHTSYNGLGILNLMFDAADTLGLDVLDLRGMLSMYEEDNISWTRIAEYYHMYCSDKSKHKLAPWSRLLNEDYLADMRLDQNLSLCRKFAGIIESPNGGEAEVWKSAVLNKTPADQKQISLLIGASCRLAAKEKDIRPLTNPLAQAMMKAMIRQYEASLKKQNEDEIEDMMI